MMRQDWRSLRVSPETSVRETMRVLDHGRLGIALVADDGDRLLGTVTDGDIRRAILCDVPLEARVEGIMERRFTWLPAGASDAAARDLMQARAIKQVPVLDAEGRLLGVFHLPDLLAGAAKPNWVVIMAGGQGRRLRPLTDDTPKPMLPVGGQPLLEITVRRLVSHGFRRIFLSLHYRGEQIESHFRDGELFDCRIEYLREEEPLDTGGALSLLPEPAGHPLLVLNGDLVTEVDFSALLEYHVQHRGAATLCVRELSRQIPYGVVRCDGDLVLRLEEKPLHRVLINAGIYVIDPRLLRLLPHGQACPLPKLIGDALDAGEQVFAFPIHERWLDIGHPTDYEQVRGGLE